MNRIALIKNLTSVKKYVNKVTGCIIFYQDKFFFDKPIEEAFTTATVLSFVNKGSDLFFDSPRQINFDNLLQKLNASQADTVTCEDVISCEALATKSDFDGIVQQFKPVQSIRLDAKKILSVSTASAQKDVRYYLNGVLIDVKSDGSIIYAATDGHRLFSVGDTTETPVREEQHIIHNQVVKLLKEFKASVIELEQSEIITGRVSRHCKINLGDVEIFFQTIDGRYPDYERVYISREVKHYSYEANTKQLKKFLEDSSKFISKPFFCIPIVFSGNRMTFLDFSVNLVGDVGKPVTMGYKINYLKDAIKFIDSETVQIVFRKVEDEMEPFRHDISSFQMIQLHNMTGDQTALVMPMRLE